MPGRDERITLLAVRSHTGEEEACVLNVMPDKKHAPAQRGFGMETNVVIKKTQHIQHIMISNFYLRNLNSVYC